MPQRRKLTHPLLLAVPWVAFYVSVFGLLYGAYQIVYLRVELGTRQQRSIDALEANPASFVWYTLDLPAKQLPATPEADDAATRAVIDRWHQTTGRTGAPTQDNDFAHLFVAAYGAWARSLDAAGAARLLRRHCGAREFRGMVKHQHDASCGGLQPTQPAACRGGFYLDDTASVKPCPDGAFCMAGQTCFVLCARGAMCNASRPLSGVVPHHSSSLQTYDRRRCVFPHNAAPPEEQSPEIHTCPGVQYLTLCPEGYYCDTPVEIQKCPLNHFCALGSDAPVRCPWFASCTREGMTRPRYRTSFGALAWGALTLLGVAYYVGSIYRDRSLRAFDEAIIRHLRAHSPPRSRASFDEDGMYALPDASPLIDVEFSEVSVRLPGGRIALKNATGALRAGRLAAIIGPSGAGKSTLLDLLAGRAPPPGSQVRGSVLLNGAAPSLCHPALVGYVPQDDGALLGWLTVRELLRFYAVRPRRLSLRSIWDRSDAIDALHRWRGGHHVRHRRDSSLASHGKWVTRRRTQAIRERRERSEEADSRERRVALCIRELGLHSERDAMLGVAGDARRRGLSGGQRKRVAVAVELCGDPSALLLDEPTSGLDAATSLAVVRALMNAARRGVCVAAVLHQPSAKAWRCLDDAVVFSDKGVAYCGPASLAARAFEAACGLQQGDAPAPDFVLDCVVSNSFSIPSSTTAPATPGATIDALREASYGVDAPGAVTQFTKFLNRAILAHTRHPGDFVFELGVQFAAGAFLGALYPHFEFRDCQQVSFILQLSLGGTVALSSAKTFGSMRQAAWRELSPTLSGYGLDPAAFCVATCLAELPRLLLITLAFLSTWFPTARPRTSFARYFWPCFCASLAASGLSHVFSVTQDSKAAQLSSVSALIACAMFSGVAPRLSELKKLGLAVKPLIWGSYARWLVESLYAAEILALSMAWRMPPAFYAKPRMESALEGLLLFGYVARAASVNCGVLALLGVFFRALTYLALVYTNRDRMGLRAPAHAFADLYARCAALVKRPRVHERAGLLAATTPRKEVSPDISV